MMKLFPSKRQIIYALGGALATAAMLVPLDGTPLLAQAVNQGGAVLKAAIAQPKMQLEMSVDLQLKQIQDGEAQVTWLELDPKQAAVVPGNILRFHVKATNHGQGGAKNFVITQAIPSETEFISNSVSLANGVSGTVTYSIDQGKTFSARPMMQVQGKPQVAPATSYTHLRIQLNQDVHPQATIAAQYEVRVK